MNKINGDDDDEDDYMSNKFLAADNAPGLMPKIFLDKHKRKEKINSISKQKPLLKVQEAEKRDEKLKIALDESNKGFKMLSKMGFKSGMGLGKQGQGRSEPIPIEIKQGRKGLGKEFEESQRKTKYLEFEAKRFKRRKVEEEYLKGDFESRLKDKHFERQFTNDLYKSQKACHHLDSLSNTEPKQPWFWPQFKKNKDENEEDQNVEEEEEEDEFDVHTKLDSLTSYLRSTHFYCIWCGATYQDNDDMLNSCPGDTFDAHE